MQSISAAPSPVCCCPIINNLRFSHLHLRKKSTSLSLSKHTQNQTHFLNFCPLVLAHTHSCIEEDNNKKRKSNSDPYHNDPFLLQFYSCTGPNNSNNRNSEQKNPEEEQKQRNNTTKITKILLTNMWWTNLKAALGQRFNFEAIVCSARVFVRDRHLALPHIVVSDIRYIDWAELRRRGFEGVVFDKDNTITVPYSLSLWAPLASSIEQCKLVFGPNVAIFSNSAGLYEYDYHGLKARALERAIGIKAIRHRVKKPAGTAEEIEKHFGCESTRLIMVGDRPLTDIVYGNQNGFLTILTEPLSLAEEPFIVRQVRKLETSLVKHWSRRGLKAISHKLLPDARLCVIDPQNV